MAIVTDNYYLSLTQDDRVLRVRCSQGDSSRNVNLFLYSNGSAFTIPSGVSASVRGVRQNGSVFSQSCSIIQGRTGVVLALNSAINGVAGIAVAEIVLTDGSGNKVGTSNFIIQVESNLLLRGTVEVGEESPVEYISDLIDVIDDLNARVNNIITPSGDASLSEVVDARLSGYSSTTYQNLKARIDADIASINNSKADKSNTYTKTEVDAALAAVTIETDSELETAGAAADAKATGDAISALNESLQNLNTVDGDVKLALAECLRNLAWKNATVGEECYKKLVSAVDHHASGKTYYYVTQNLTGATSDCSVLSVESGTALSVQLTFKSGYSNVEVTVTMGGVDVTSSKYNSSTGVVSISSVTGDVSITVTGTAVYITDSLAYRWVASDSDGSTWVDRVSSASIALTNVTKETNRLVFNGSTSYGYMANGPTGAQTLEVVYALATNNIRFVVVKTPSLGCGCGSSARYPQVLSATSSVDLHEFVLPSKNTVHSDVSVYTGTLEMAGYNTYYEGAQATVKGNTRAGYFHNNTGGIEIGATLTSEGEISEYAFLGSIYEIRIHSRALTAEEIKHNYLVDAETYPLGG